MQKVSRLVFELNSLHEILHNYFHHKLRMVFFRFLKYASILIYFIEAPDAARTTILYCIVLYCRPGPLLVTVSQAVKQAEKEQQRQIQWQTLFVTWLIYRLYSRLAT